MIDADSHPEYLRLRLSVFATDPIGRHLSGESNREIARQERIDRFTVSKILSQPEVADLLARYQSRLLTAGLPSAIEAIEEVLGSDDLRLRAITALKLIESVLLNKAGMENLESGRPAPPPEDRERRLVTEMVAMTLEKARRWRADCPALDSMKHEAEQRLGVDSQNRQE